MHGWVVLAQGFSWSCNQAVDWGCSYFQLDDLLLSSLMCILVDISPCWLLTRGFTFLPCGAFHRLPVSLWHGTQSKPLEKEREPKIELAIFSNLILEVACYYFRCILFVTWTILGTVWKETVLWGPRWKLAVIPRMSYSVQKTTKQHWEQIISGQIPV